MGPNMHHTLQAEGYGVRLRPVKMEDAAFIVWVRNLAHAKGRLGDSATDAFSQEKWLQQYFERPGDYYFIIETQGGISVGAYGLYGHTGDSAESGRWVIRPEVAAAIPSSILAFDLAFGTLALRELRVSTVSTNQPVLSLNRKFGFRQIGVDKEAQVIGGKPVDLVHFLLNGTDWPTVRTGLLPLARVAERQVIEWEQGQK